MTLGAVIFIKASLLHLLSQGICSHRYCPVWQGVLLDRVSFMIYGLAVLLGFRVWGFISASLREITTPAVCKKLLERGKKLSALHVYEGTLKNYWPEPASGKIWVRNSFLKGRRTEQVKRLPGPEEPASQESFKDRYTIHRVLVGSHFRTGRWTISLLTFIPALLIS